MNGSVAEIDAPGEQAPKQRRADRQGEDLRRAPAVAATAPSERKHQRNRAGRHKDGAEHVELVRTIMARQPPEHVVGQQKGERRERHVDPEDPRPVQLLGDEAAEQRSAHHRDDEGRRGIGLVARALARRSDVADDGLHQGHQAAAAEPLQRARADQRQHGRRQRAGDRAQRENADGDEQHGAPPVDVGELAVERRHRGAAQQVGGHHPGHVVDVAEARRDGRQRGRDHDLVERRQHHGEEDADHDAPRRSVVERRIVRQRRRRSRIAHQRGLAPSRGGEGAKVL